MRNKKVQNAILIHIFSVKYGVLITYLHVHTYVYTQIYIYIHALDTQINVSTSLHFIIVFVHVCMRETQRDT